MRVVASLLCKYARRKAVGVFVCYMVPEISSISSYMVCGLHVHCTSTMPCATLYTCYDVISGGSRIFGRVLRQ